MFVPKKTPDELEEENAQLEREISVKQKRAVLEKLKGNGMSLQKDFNGNLRAAWNWVRTHL
jgi:uncharacterized protein (DUF4415 family)